MTSTSTRTRRLWIAATALTAVAAVVTALFSLTNAVAEPPAPAPAATPVAVATVVQREVSIWDEFSGRLEAVERVDLRSRVAGAVLAVHFHEGSLVRQGDLLVTIDPAPYQAEVDRADAQVVAAQARLSYSRSTAERGQRLLSDHAIAQRELDEQQNGLREAEANLRAAQAALQTARLNLSYTQVRAPVSGRVGRIEVTVGNLVAAGPGAPVLTTLVSVSPIYASFDADEQIVGRALRDTAVTTKAGGKREATAMRGGLDRIPVQMGTAGTVDTPFEGRLQLVDNQVDARSGTVRVRAVFDNADGTLMPGQFARLRMGQAHTAQALLINERAVATDQNKKYVLVVGKDNLATYREVQLGALVDGLRIVTAGLKPEERIVLNGLQRVRPGALVQPQPADMSAKAEVQARNTAAVKS